MDVVSKYRNANEIWLTLIDGKEVHDNPLDWRKLNSGKYPILRSIARRILCVPATSAPCERLFSYARLTISNDRNRLLPENAEEFIFLRVAWPKVDSLKRKNLVLSELYNSHAPQRLENGRLAVLVRGL